MAINRDKRSRPVIHGFTGGIHLFALFLAVGLLLFQMVSSIFSAMTLSPLAAIRSMAAAGLPISVAAYFSFLARVQMPTHRSRAPIVNNYVLFGLWTLLLLGIDGSNEYVYFPLEELLYSLTIAFLIWRYKRQDSFKDLLACCYGILSGALASVILFGWNPTTM
jgi:hypothetical protein